MMNKEFWKKVKLLILDWDMEIEQLQKWKTQRYMKELEWFKQTDISFMKPYIYIEVIASPGITQIHNL